MVCDQAVCEKMISGGTSSSGACDGPRHRLYVAIKNAAEWLAALGLSLFLGPVILVLAAAVRATSPGPAFYSQIRQGRNGRPFKILKLRSMAHNCEQATGAVWSSGASDPRVTRFGRFLRDTHLDELPQIWNVLRGEMCLIGPRPERPEIASRLERAFPCYKHRLMVQPGVTGLAQVQLPPDSDLESVRRKLAYDLHYVREVSPMMDMRILVATFFKFLASGIEALSHALVKNERTSVEAQNYGGLKIVAADAWRVGAA